MKTQTNPDQTTSRDTPTPEDACVARQNIAAITAGEWKERTSHDGFLDIISGTNFICRVGPSEFPAVQYDGRLICAAPELLKALSKSTDVLLRCEAALFTLLKTGRENISEGHVREIDILRHAAKDLALEEARPAIQSATL